MRGAGRRTAGIVVIKNITKETTRITTAIIAAIVAVVIVVITIAVIDRVSKNSRTTTHCWMGRIRIIAVGQHIVIIGIQIYSSWMIKNGTLWGNDNVAGIIRVIMGIPVSAGRPWIIPVITIVVTIVIPVAIVIIVI